ncbi:MAG: NCS1 family nucleobase:cation symporter-1 [Clostridiales bacterium]|nr:NCS1 family nucleobase:cation symporter-1 [Clostridiales bacterium]
MSKYTQIERSGLFELTDVARAELTSSKYYNEDLAPTSLSQRTWTTYNIAALWIGMSICIPSFTMASGLVGLGLSPWAAVFNVTLGNLIVLIPMQLNSHAGTKYGIPFPVFARLTFGSIGAHIPSLSRALTACGWCAIQSWIGGAAIVVFVGAFIKPFKQMGTINLMGIDVSTAQLIGFFVFLGIVLWISYRGSEGIKWMEAIGAPVLVALSIALLFWSTSIAFKDGFGIGEIIQASTNTDAVAANGGYMYIFLAGLTANIAFWATMALNIPDFSRYARSQKAQFRGQLYGMPLMMFFCAFVGAYFAQATFLVFGQATFDPTDVLYQLENPIIAVVVSFGVAIATLTTNIAANVVAPANGFSNLVPSKISYKVGVIIACVLAILYRPWWIFGGPGAYLFGWLGTYGTILAPIAAIFVADYYIVKNRTIDVMALFQGNGGRYWYQGGFNIRAIVAWVLAFIIPVFGNPETFDMFGGFGSWVAANGYLFSFFVGLLLYWLFMRNEKSSLLTDEEHEAMTDRAAVKV